MGGDPESSQLPVEIQERLQRQRLKTYFYRWALFHFLLSIAVTPANVVMSAMKAFMERVCRLFVMSNTVTSKSKTFRSFLQFALLSAVRFLGKNLENFG